MFTIASVTQVPLLLRFRARTCSHSPTRSPRTRRQHPQALPLPPADFSACAFDFTSTGISRHASSTSPTAAPFAPADVVVSGPSPLSLACHPLSLTLAESKALTSQSQSQVPQTAPCEPAIASFVPLSPETSNEILVPPPSEEIRPYTPLLPSHAASRVDASAASSSTAVITAHSTSKSCSLMRRAERANSRVKSVARQAAPSGPVLSYTVTRVSTKLAAAAAATASSALPMASNSSTHANLQQFAYPPHATRRCHYSVLCRLASSNRVLNRRQRRNLVARVQRVCNRLLRWPLRRARSL